MKKCQSCGDKFDPDEPVEFDTPSEDMAAEIDVAMERGVNCPDCIFSTAFENESIKDLEEDDY